MRRRQTVRSRRFAKGLPGQLLVRLRIAPLARLRAPLKWSGVHLVTLALVVLTLSLLVNFGSQVIQSARLEARRAELAAEVAQLEAEKRLLEGAVAHAESDVHVERVAREQLGYAREGDTVLLPQMPLSTPVPTATPAPALPTPAPDPNWQRWWSALFAPALP